MDACDMPGAKEYIAQLVAFLQAGVPCPEGQTGRGCAAGGPVSISYLGEKVRRPQGVPKMRKVLLSRRGQQVFWLHEELDDESRRDTTMVYLRGTAAEQLQRRRMEAVEAERDAEERERRVAAAMAAEDRLALGPGPWTLDPGLAAEDRLAATAAATYAAERAEAHWIGATEEVAEDGAAAVRPSLPERGAMEEAAVEAVEAVEEATVEVAEKAMEGGAVKEVGGLKLQLSSRNSTGYLGVNRCHSQRRGGSKLFQAQLYRDGHSVFLGWHSTAVEAAMAVARYLAKCEGDGGGGGEVTGAVSRVQGPGSRVAGAK